MDSWEEVFLFSVDFSVPELFGVCVAGCTFLKAKLAFAFLTACVYWSLTSLKSGISQGLFDANAECHRIVLCLSRAVKSGVNQGLISVLSSTFFEWGHAYLRW